MNSPRRDALQVFMDVVEDGAYANLRLKDIHRAPSEQAYVSSLVYTALEHVKWADYMLSFYVKPQKKAVRNILRLGVSELFFMDTPDHAAVNGAVELTKECGKGALSGLVNGVLRRMLREKDSLPPPDVLFEEFNLSGRRGKRTAPLPNSTAGLALYYAVKDAEDTSYRMLDYILRSSIKNN